MAKKNAPFEFERYGAGAGRGYAGRLVKYTSLGCYPVFYLDSDGAVLCASDANAMEHAGAVEPYVIVAADVNWEDPDLHCDACGERIETAYAEEARAMEEKEGAE